MTWSVPECPFTVECPDAVMAQIQAAALEGLFAVPHGGAEIGGVLVGTHDGSVVHILAARPLECEYALGPRFTLSGKDHGRLAALLDQGCDDLREKGWEPAGWYHSHTRSEVLMSERDLDVHKHYFSEPWQVALVVRPHAMQPAQVGFFFPSSVGVRPSCPQPVVSRLGERSALRHPPKWLWWAAILLGAVLGMVLSQFAFKRVFAAGRPPSAGLTAYDVHGQLQIRWDWAAEPIRSAKGGSLEIVDGATHTVVPLDRQRLRAGTVGYVRIGARVEVSLTLQERGGDLYQEFITLIGLEGGRDPASRSRDSTAAVTTWR